MFVSHVAISLQIPGLEKKSLVKITSLVYNSCIFEVYTVDKLVHMCNFGIVLHFEVAQAVAEEMTEHVTDTHIRCTQ